MDIKVLPCLLYAHPRARMMKPYREERRDAAPRYHALNDHPSFRTFGTPDFVDAQGREYRVGPRKGPLVQLYVRLPRPEVPWFAPVAGRDVTLLSDNGVPQTIRIHEDFIMPAHRTGHVYIRAEEAPYRR